MSAPRDQVFVSGLKIEVTLMPMCVAWACPPTTRTRPSASVTCAAQWTSPKGAGFAESWPVAGLKMCASSPLDHTRTLPVCMSTMCLPCTGQFSNGPHCPTCAGGPSSATLGAAATPSMAIASATTRAGRNPLIMRTP